MEKLIVGFGVQNVNSSGSLNNTAFCLISSKGSINSASLEYGLRPIFHLRSNIKVTGGTGKTEHPYILGI
jgi:hypothetical protein